MLEARALSSGRTNGRASRTDVCVVGRGALSDAVTAACRAVFDGQPVGAAAVRAWSPDRSAPESADCALVISVTNGPRPAGEPGGVEGGAPWLSVHVEFGQVVIGPVELEGWAGCVACARVRHERLQRRGLIERRFAGATAARGCDPSPLLSQLGADTAGAIVADAARRMVAGDLPFLRSALVTVDLRSLAVSRHPFLPDPSCPICGSLPEDTADEAQVVLQPRPKLSHDAYRLVTEGQLARLTDLYVDEEVGLIGKVIPGSSRGLVTSTASVGLRGGEALMGWGGFGRNRSLRASQLVAITEALERYGGTHPGGRRTTVQGCYADLAEVALDPRTLGLHSEEDYRRPGYEFRPFDVETPCRWVWGYSFRQDRPLLVPESMAYFRARGHDDERSFAYDCSHGCALGGSLEEAVLFATLEVAESDGFLMTWYAQMPVPRIDLESSSSGTAPLLAAHIRSTLDYDVLAFDTTLEQLIPSVWAVAVNRHDDGRPALLSGTAAHPLAEHAVISALSELTGMFDLLAPELARRPQRARRMVNEPDLVRTLDDHMLLYACRDALPRLDFLPTDRPGRSLEQIQRSALALSHDDLRQDLTAVLAAYTDEGLDVVVVDQTTPEHRAGELACVKVLVPGTLPMTFGHHQRRISGVARLAEIPRRLGHRDRPLSPHEMNPHPHPFP